MYGEASITGVPGLFPGKGIFLLGSLASSCGDGFYHSHRELELGTPNPHLAKLRPKDRKLTNGDFGTDRTAIFYCLLLFLIPGSRVVPPNYSILP